MTLEGDTLFQIKKCWDAFLSAFFQYLSTSKSWPPYKKLRAEHHKISKCILPPDTHPKYATEKEKYTNAFGCLPRSKFIYLASTIIQMARKV